MKLPITDGESGPDMKYPVHNVVHICSNPDWPPSAGDKQGISYIGLFASLFCKHQHKETFFRVCYDRRGPLSSGIKTYEGIACKDCGKITWEYES